MTWDCIRNFKTSELTFTQPINATERAWLVGTLARKRGVRTAHFDEFNGSHLTVEHDADVMGTLALVELLRVFGMYVEPTLVQPRASTTVAAEHSPETARRRAQAEPAHRTGEPRRRNVLLKNRTARSHLKQEDCAVMHD